MGLAGGADIQFGDDAQTQTTAGANAAIGLHGVGFQYAGTTTAHGRSLYIAGHALRILIHSAVIERHPRTAQDGEIAALLRCQFL